MKIIMIATGIGVLALLAIGAYYFSRPKSCVDIQMAKWHTDQAVAAGMCKGKQS